MESRSRPRAVAEARRHDRGVDDVGEQERCQRPSVRTEQAETRECSQTCPLDLHARFVSDDEAVVAGWNLEHIVRAELDGRPVAHGHPEPS